MNLLICLDQVEYKRIRVIHEEPLINEYNVLNTKKKLHSKLYSIYGQKDTSSS